jgi:hypothetical protein
MKPYLHSAITEGSSSSVSCKQRPATNRWDTGCDPQLNYRKCFWLALVTCAREQSAEPSVEGLWFNFLFLNPHGLSSKQDSFFISLFLVRPLQRIQFTQPTCTSYSYFSSISSNTGPALTLTGCLRLVVNRLIKSKRFVVTCDGCSREVQKNTAESRSANREY